VWVRKQTTMSQSTNTRGPNGRALNKDGTERKARTTLSPAEKAAKARKAVRDAAKSMGADAIKHVDSLATFRGGIATVRGYLRTAAEYSTPEKCAAKRAYFERMADMVDAKGEAARSYLDGAKDTVKSLETFEAAVGNDIMEYIDENEYEPDASESEAIVREHLSADVVSFVEGAADPELDPFLNFRRAKDTDDGEDSDTL